MKATFQTAILALALSVSAAPVEKFPSADKGVNSSPSQTSGGRPSEGRGGDEYGPPTFFGDDSGAPRGPPRGYNPKASSPSSAPYVPSNTNGSTVAASSPSISTSVSTPDTVDKRTLAPAKLVTPDFKSFISKAGTVMFGMQNNVCSEVTLIFARGTTEKGNMGTCVGPELAEALRDEIPSLSVQGVDYPANSKGNTKYGASGGPYMAMLAREARKQCPKTKIVLAGYSQGARVIHGALDHVDNPFDGNDVSAVVAFGDPLNGKDHFPGVDRDDVLQVCGDSDDRCQKGKVDMWIHGGHISYGKSAEDVAKWIKKTVG